MKKERYTVIRTKLLEIYHDLQISNEEMLFLIHLLSFQQEQDDFPSIQILQARMNYNDEKMYDVIASLMERGILGIENTKNDQGQSREQYSFTPLYDKIERLDQNQVNQIVETQTENEEREVFEMLETEFGRQLSPIEYQQVSSWFTKDSFDVPTIKEAIKEAVLNQVYSLRYIDRILINWKKQNKKTTYADRRYTNNNNRVGEDNIDLPPVPLKKFLDR